MNCTPKVGNNIWGVCFYTPVNIVKKLTETFYDNYSFAGKSSYVAAGSTSCATGFLQMLLRQ